MKKMLQFLNIEAIFYKQKIIREITPKADKSHVLPRIAVI